jgi:hypothetical protein
MKKNKKVVVVVVIMTTRHSKRATQLCSTLFPVACDSGLVSPSAMFDDCWLPSADGFRLLSENLNSVIVAGLRRSPIETFRQQFLRNRKREDDAPVAGAEASLIDFNYE